MMSFRKLLAMGMVATTALGVCAVAFSANPVMVYAEEAEEPEGETSTSATKTATFNGRAIEISGTKGNFIYIEFYSDQEGKKLKNTYVIPKGSDGTTGFDVTNIMGKKGCSFLAYGELDDKSKVELCIVPAQGGKLKVKAADFTADTIYEMYEIDADGTKLSESNIAEYDGIAEDGKKEKGSIYVNIGGYYSSIAEEGLAELVNSITVTGGTMYFQYAPADMLAGKEVKVKIPAAGKAPKVTVDYVNGTYVIPAKASYWITKYSTEAGITVPELVDKDGKSTGTVVDKKLSLSVDDVLSTEAAGATVSEGKVTAKAAAAALYVQTEASGKKPASLVKLEVVEALTELEATASDDKATVTVKTKVEKDATEVATIKCTDTTVKITAKVDMAYFDTAKDKWAILKAGKETKDIAVKTGESIKIKQLGTKATKTAAGVFGSAELEVKNEYVAPTATPTPTPETTTTPAA